VSEKESSYSKVLWIIVPVVILGIVGIFTHGFGLVNHAQTPTINGATTVPVTKLAGLSGVTDANFYLQGYSDGGYSSMYWTDAYGNTIDFAGDGVNQPFMCPDVGTYQVTLTEVNNEGYRGQATQTINCVARNSG
jgi:hypothetical protein